MWFEPQGKLGIFSTLLLLCWQGFRDWLTAIRGTTAAAARNQIFISRVPGAYIAYCHDIGGMVCIHCIFYIFFSYSFHILHIESAAYWFGFLHIFGYFLGYFFWIFFTFLHNEHIFFHIYYYFCIFCAYSSAHSAYVLHIEHIVFIFIASFVHIFCILCICICIFFIFLTCWSPSKACLV